MWWPYEERWMEMYHRLILYKKKHKTASVPRRYKEDSRLATWVHTQRKCYKKKELSIERINYLESIGFVWKIVNYVPWIDMYDRLVTYKHCHQSTLVPQQYTEDTSLGQWVSKQRFKYKKGKLLEKQMELLNSIDFVWSMKGGK